MLQQIIKMLLFLGISLGILCVWGAQATWVNQDARRRRLERVDVWYWTAMAIVLGPMGAAVYLVSKWITPWFTLPVQPNDAIARGDTFPHLASPDPSHQPTQPVLAEARPSRPDSHVIETQPNIVDPRGGYCLEVIAGPEAGLVYPLDVLPQRIGRGPEAQIRLDRDRTVSRKHADVYEEEGQLRIRDLLSMQGIFVNDLVVFEQVLHPGDRIRIGRSVLELGIEGQRGR